ncbi:MAG: tRNA (cytidine(34)-2'-O)-methyltransferase [Proteobacteria bacterium]|nr:tRNA (cytidine(34)-2'-O)-methyltransferase [Pseudomonadota bacterium]
MKRPSSPLHVVLVEPEIPQNTGNIARLCAATGSDLHLVGKLGFKTDEKAVRRAGLDYWHLVNVEEHADLESCLQKIGQLNPLLFTTRSEKCYLKAPYEPGSALVFGKETKGLSREITDRYSNRLFGIPTVDSSVRSLNLANAVSAAVYEALRATGAFNSTTMGP